MAVTLDIGNPDNVHPADKQAVGHRLALAARALSYGERMGYSGPLFARADVEGDAVRVSFAEPAGDLTCGGGTCVGFEVAGVDHRFVQADAALAGRSLVVKSGSVPAARFVRYAWTNAPEANLFNNSGLPASTFTSEDTAGSLMPHE